MIPLKYGALSVSKLEKLYLHKVLHQILRALPD